MPLNPPWCSTVCETSAQKFSCVAKVGGRLKHLQSHQWVSFIVFFSGILHFMACGQVVRRASNDSSQHVVLWVHLTNIIRKVVISTGLGQSCFACFCDCPFSSPHFWSSNTHNSDILWHPLHIIVTATTHHSGIHYASLSTWG